PSGAGRAPGGAARPRAGCPRHRPRPAACSEGRRLSRRFYARVVRGLMMDYQLTLPTLLRRAETYFPDKEIVSRLADRSFGRTAYGEVCERSRRLAVALGRLGLERGDRVATLCWNHAQHLECYFGISCGAFVLHTLNL